MILNIRGTSGSGKSHLVKRYLADHKTLDIIGTMGPWPHARTMSIACWPKDAGMGQIAETMIIGRYDTNCGGCDSISYKGCYEDIDQMIRRYAKTSNVIFEGLVATSVIGRWMRIADDIGHANYCFMYMDTSLEVCLERILARSGGRYPKRTELGTADFQTKYKNAMHQIGLLRGKGYWVEEISSDDVGYARMNAVLEAWQ